MTIECLSWSTPQLPELERRVLFRLAEAINEFMSGSEGLGDGDDYVYTASFRGEMHRTVASLCEHFEVPNLDPRTYDDTGSKRMGRPHSWNLAIDNTLAAAGIVRAIRSQSASDSQVYRPKVLERAHAEVMRWLQEHPKDVDRVHPRTFEAIVAEILQDKGWQVELTKSTCDGGYDILCLKTDKAGFPIKTVVECKLYSLQRHVGLPMVDRLVGAGKRDSAQEVVLVTNSRFTGTAWRLWQEHIGRGLSLIDRDELFDWLTGYRGTNSTST